MNGRDIEKDGKTGKTLSVIGAGKSRVGKLVFRNKTAYVIIFR